MPLYEYQCESCDYRVEEFRPMGDRLRESFCDKCGRGMKLKIGTPSFKVWDYDPAAMDASADRKRAGMQA